MNQNDENQRNKRQEGAWNLLLAKFIFPLFTFLVGFTGSQLLVIQAVKEKQIVHETHLTQLDRDLIRETDQRVADDLEIRRHLDYDRQQTEERMKNVVVLMESIMKQNTEVIGLFKIQQQMAK